MSDPSSVHAGNLDTDADDVLAFCLEQLQGFTREHFDKYFRGNPSGAPLFVVARDGDGTLTGTASLYPAPFVSGGDLRDGAIAGDFVVRDDLRGFGPALALQRELLALAADRGWAIAIGFPNPPARAVLKRVGYRDVAPFTRFTRPIGRGEHVTALLGRRSPGVESPASFDERFAAVWEARAPAELEAHRSAERENWRFEFDATRPGPYSISALVDGPTVRAYSVSHVVYGRRRIVDLAWTDAGGLEAVLRHDIARARRERLGGVDLRYLGRPGQLLPTLAALGFAGEEGPYAIVRPSGEEPAVFEAARWELFRGAFDI